VGSAATGFCYLGGILQLFHRRYQQIFSTSTRSTNFTAAHNRSTQIDSTEFIINISYRLHRQDLHRFIVKFVEVDRRMRVVGGILPRAMRDKKGKRKFSGRSETFDIKVKVAATSVINKSRRARKGSQRWCSAVLFSKVMMPGQVLRKKLRLDQTEDASKPTRTRGSRLRQRLRDSKPNNAGFMTIRSSLAYQLIGKVNKV
jgi:hypothetical protein